MAELLYSLFEFWQMCFIKSIFMLPLEMGVIMRKMNGRSLLVVHPFCLVNVFINPQVFELKSLCGACTVGKANEIYSLTNKSIHNSICIKQQV